MKNIFKPLKTLSFWAETFVLLLTFQFWINLPPLWEHWTYWALSGVAVFTIWKQTIKMIKDG